MDPLPDGPMTADDVASVEKLYQSEWTEELRQFFMTAGRSRVAHAGFFIRPETTRELREEIADDFDYEEGYGLMGGIDSVGDVPDDSALVIGMRSGNSLGYFYFYDVAGPTPGRMTLLRLGYRRRGPLGVFAAPTLRAWLECTLDIVESGRLDPGKAPLPCEAFTGDQFVLEDFQDIIDAHGCGPDMAMLLS